MREQQVERLSDEYYEKYEMPIPADTISVYLIPSVESTLLNSKETFGKQYDDVERKMIEGSIPQLWEKRIV